jgi:hypothetical protein
MEVYRPNIQEGFLVETLGEQARDLTGGMAREASEQFRIDARDFLSARERGWTAGTRIEQQTAALSDAAEIVTAQSSVRGFTLVGRERFLDPFQIDRRAIDIQFGRTLRDGTGAEANVDHRVCTQFLGLRQHPFDGRTPRLGQQFRIATQLAANQILQPRGDIAPHVLGPHHVALHNPQHLRNPITGNRLGIYDNHDANPHVKKKLPAWR